MLLIRPFFLLDTILVRIRNISMADPRSEKIHYGSGSRPNFDTDPDPQHCGTPKNMLQTIFENHIYTKELNLMAVLRIRINFSDSNVYL